MLSQRAFRQRPGVIWLLTATLTAVCSTYAVVVSTSLLAQFVHNDQYTLLLSFGAWQLFALVSVVALPVWLAVAVAALLTGRQVIAQTRQKSVWPWRVCLGLWAGGVALILAVGPWSVDSVPGFYSLVTRELAAPLFPLAGIDAVPAVLLNTALFTIIGAISGGGAFLRARRGAIDTGEQA